jgi:hypothetical protein
VSVPPDPLGHEPPTDLGLPLGYEETYGPLPEGVSVGYEADDGKTESFRHGGYEPGEAIDLLSEAHRLLDLAARAPNGEEFMRHFDHDGAIALIRRLASMGYSDA